MRMWMVPPDTMCRKHLLGEHVELHMLVGHLKRGRKLGRYASDGLVELGSIYRRHRELSHEMRVRGYQHKSPLDWTTELEGRLMKLEVFERTAVVDRKQSLIELHRRCSDCARRYAMTMCETKGCGYVSI